jgi:glyoxylase-like metal-dependent hydrolase (beta-lactamase superfamily II)
MLPLTRIVSSPLARFAALVVLMTPAFADESFRLDHKEVAPGIHALVGPTGARTYGNHGLNANFGVIDTAEGAALIDSGASQQGAQLLEAEATRLTGKPVRWVINTGAQDHRWLGNGYFRGKGIEVIALARTAATQQENALAQLDSLRPVLKERLDGTEPVSANRRFDGTHETLELGGRRIEIHYFADAHFPGDVVVWLPQDRVAFSGDHVYVDRMLGILPQSNAESWLQAFEALKALQPAVIVPGHGAVTDLAKAQADTGDYLAFIVSGVKALADDMAGVDEAVAKLGDAPQFARLANYDELHRGNVSRAYLRFESAQ